MELNHRQITVDGVNTHYLEAGSGPSTIVLLHGGGLDDAQLSWELLMPELAPNHHVFAIDWPGFGQSEPLQQPVSIEAYVGFLGAFLDALGIQRASLVGISMGGGIALGFILKHPERVERLVLVDSYGLQRTAPMHFLSSLYVKTPGLLELSWALMRSRPMVRASLQMLLRRPGAVTGELVEQVYRQIRRPGVEKTWTAFQKSEITWKSTRTCYLDRLEEIHAPTLIVHGSKDELVPRDCSREANRRIRGSRLVWMEGCGHWPQRDDAQGFNKVVAAFLADEV